MVNASSSYHSHPLALWGAHWQRLPTHANHNHTDAFEDFLTKSSKLPVWDFTKKKNWLGSQATISEVPARRRAPRLIRPCQGAQVRIPGTVPALVQTQSSGGAKPRNPSFHPWVHFLVETTRGLKRRGTGWVATRRGGSGRRSVDRTKAERSSRSSSAT